MNRQRIEYDIRRAAHSDAPELCALAQKTYTDAFGASMSAIDLQRHLENHLALSQVETFLRDDIVLVAAHNGQLVGFVQGGALDGNVRVQEVRRLYVLRDFQKQGIGTQLLQAALTHPQMQNAEKIVLDVWERNHGARRLYEHFGFRVSGKQKFTVASGAETDLDLIMVRDQTC